MAPARSVWFPGCASGIQGLLDFLDQCFGAGSESQKRAEAFARGSEFLEHALHMYANHVICGRQIIADRSLGPETTEAVVLRGVHQQSQRRAHAMSSSFLLLRWFVG